MFVDQAIYQTTSCVQAKIGKKMLDSNQTTNRLHHNGIEQKQGGLCSWVGNNVWGQITVVANIDSYELI